jgi:outer membrane autotransporter protein
VIVNYLDLNLIGDRVQANLPAFGLTSAGACPGTPCVIDAGFANQYLFYVDQVHLTSAGFAIVGKYAVAQLEAPLTFRSQSDLALSAASDFGQMMSGRLDLRGEPENGLSFFVVGTAAKHDVRETMTNRAYDYDNAGVAGGVEVGFGMGRIGGAVSYTRPRTDSLSGNSSMRAKTLSFGGYAQFEGGGAFAEGYAGIGRYDLDIRRSAVIDNLNATTDADGIVAGAEVGYLAGMGGARIGPVAGVQYARAEIDGYSEAGDPVLTLNVQEQRASETIGFAGLKAEFGAGAGGLAMKPFVKLLAEKQIGGSTSDIRYALTAAPGIVNTFQLQQGQRDLYGRLEGGVSISLGRTLSLEAQASTTFEHPEHNELSGFAGFKLGF